MEIAVVIPALDEADRIAEAIWSARGPESSSACRTSAGPGAGSGRPRPGCGAHPAPSEILVVDGGSRDDTVERARRAGARVLRSEPGRARQLEAGWRASTGEVVVFLHADTRLGDGWPAAVRSALADPAVVGGAFRLRFDERSPGLRLIEAGAALRARLFGLPYGDQAIFVRRRILEEIGGIPPVRLMEDIDLVAAMKARGRLALLSAPVITSARRYREGGVAATFVRHTVALLARRAGVDRARIARWIGR